MEAREFLLTTEDIKKKNINQFTLVAEAIKMAAEMVASGRPPRVQIDNGNPAVIVLEEIRLGKDKLDVTEEHKGKEPEAPASTPPPLREKGEVKKKPRRIMA
jgi:DNA-directed RNA polymerase subunit K/omega